MCSMKSSSRVLEPREPTPPRAWARNSAKRCALDISEMRYGDYHIVVGIEVLGVEVAGSVVDVGLACIAIFVADFKQPRS